VRPGLHSSEVAIGVDEVTSLTGAEIEEIMGMSLSAMRIFASTDEAMARLLRLAFACGCLTGQHTAFQDTNKAFHEHTFGAVARKGGN